MAIQDQKRIEDRLDKISEEISEMNKTLAINTTQLEIHIEGVKLAREQNNLLKEEFDRQLRRINAHIDFVQGAAAAITIIGAIVVALHQMGVLQKLLI